MGSPLGLILADTPHLEESNDLKINDLVLCRQHLDNMLVVATTNNN